MNKELERYLILFLLLMLIGLSGCAKKQIINSNPVLPDTVTDTVGNPIPDEDKKPDAGGVARMEGIANALVCMFSPDTCETTKQERKMDR
jgi:hypothetical protein|tara:strand:+ start:396 stop:665 length:270 start_codon:yes stop_codon:yes gene_type:complete